MQHPIPVTLSEKDRASLQTFLHAGKANARTFTRAHVLLKAAEGWTDPQICEVFGITRNTSIRVRQLYLSGELEAVLKEVAVVGRLYPEAGADEAGRAAAWVLGSGRAGANSVMRSGVGSSWCPNSRRRFHTHCEISCQHSCPHAA